VLEKMIVSTQRGILCTRFWSIRGVDQRTIPFSALTRDGTFLIENGKITRPIKNMRWNESPIFCRGGHGPPPRQLNALGGSLLI
jgi:predicted Zn-dependent protease